MPSFAVDLGLFVYDRLTDRPERHGHPSAEEVARIALSLDLSRLDRALAYQDAIADDRRIGGVVLRDVETGRAHRALLWRRVPARGASVV